MNCVYKNDTYNLKMNDEHEALDSECPTYRRMLQREEKKIGWGNKA